MIFYDFQTIEFYVILCFSYTLKENELILSNIKLEKNTLGVFKNTKKNQYIEIYLFGLGLKFNKRKKNYLPSKLLK